METIDTSELIHSTHEALTLAWAFDPAPLPRLPRAAGPQGWISDEKPPWRPTFKTVYDQTGLDLVKEQLLQIMNFRRYHEIITLFTEIESDHIKFVKALCDEVDEWEAGDVTFMFNDDFEFDEDGAYPMEEVTNDLQPRALFQDGTDHGLSIPQKKALCSKGLEVVDGVMEREGKMLEADYITLCNVLKKIHQG